MGEVNFYWWCWSRKDWSEKAVQNVTIIKEIREITFDNMFSASFFFNGTHLRCRTDEEWGKKWNDVEDYNSIVYCNTSISPLAAFLWINQNNRL